MPYQPRRAPHLRPFRLCPIAPLLLLALATLFTSPLLAAQNDLEQRFTNPPPEARPQVYWFWMGSNITKSGITRDLEALKDAGFGGTTMCNLADVCTPWPRSIPNSLNPGMVEYQSDQWWDFVRYAAAESRRLGLEFGIHNCPGYESSGGPWITPEFSMQEVVWSETPVKGPSHFVGSLPRPTPDLHAHEPFPVYNDDTGKLEKPIVPARRDYFKDIAVLALPAKGTAPLDQVINLTSRMSPAGELTWDVPPGDWILYRFGHTTTGAMIQPCQWKAIGLECDKMNPDAVQFHLRHVLSDAKNHLGDLFGHGLDYIWFDSYEAGTPTWTPRMPQEFSARRHYDLLPFLPTLAHRTVGSPADTKKFQQDFKQTIQDLYRDVYFATIQRECHAAGIQARSEPYGGPWKIADAVPFFDQVSAEFWTKDGKYSPYAVRDVVDAAHAAGTRVITAEAFTGRPLDSEWNETPASLKTIGDAAFCDGINRFMLHRFTLQPFDDRYQPGMSMGQWGTHFDRTQTWWKPGKAWVQYLQRCDALLQWGNPADKDFSASAPALQAAHRTDGSTDLFFVANISHNPVSATCAFATVGKQPELWDPVTDTHRALPEFSAADGRTTLPLQFAPAQSYFIVFQHPGVPPAAPAAENFPNLTPAGEVTGPWKVSFDPKWGGPAQVTFDTLTDWTQRPEPGIKYYSGTATYTNTFDLPPALASTRAPIYLDLGTVHALARVRLNDTDLGVLWTAPWHVDISAALRPGHNRLHIQITNTWANRLIGDEQQPPDCHWNRGDQKNTGGPLQAFPNWLLHNLPRPSPGRFTFTTWNYFNKNSPLTPSGLLGPVRLLTQQ